MGRTKVIIRADGNHKIGLGHIYRSLALSKQFKKNKCQVFFLSRKNNVAKQLLASENSIFISKTNELKIIKNIQPDIILLDRKIDSYCFKYQKLLKENCKVFAAFDGFPKRKIVADILFNQSHHVVGKKSETVLSSFKYVVIRSEFRNLRKKYQVRKKVKNILVLQGGADTHGQIPRVVNILSNIDKNICIYIVIGAAFKHQKQLEEAISGCKKITKVYNNIEKIGQIMIKSDIAITAGGMSLLELCCLGVPTLTWCAEKSEEITAMRVEKFGATINIGYYKQASNELLVKRLEDLIDNYNLRKKLNIKQRTLIDGLGTKRVVKKVVEMLKTKNSN